MTWVERKSPFKQRARSLWEEPVSKCVYNCLVISQTSTFLVTKYCDVGKMLRAFPSQLLANTPLHMCRWNSFFNQGQVKWTVCGELHIWIQAIWNLTTLHFVLRTLWLRSASYFFLSSLSTNAFLHKEHFTKVEYSD